MYEAAGNTVPSLHKIVYMKNNVMKKSLSKTHWALFKSDAFLVTQNLKLFHLPLLKEVLAIIKSRTALHFLIINHAERKDARSNV